MTKLKNTKKGMAKKALSISLVAAMLATSNVPVWAAEDLFSDGSAAVEAEVDAFSAEASAEDIAPVIEESDNSAVLKSEASSNAYEATVNFTGVTDNKITWGNDVTANLSVKNAETGAAATNVYYAWKLDGKADSETALPQNGSVTADSTNITNAANAGKSLTLFLTVKDTDGNIVWTYTSDAILIRAIDVSTLYKSASIAGTYTFNGNNQTIAASDVTLTKNDNTTEVLTASAAGFTIVQSGDHKNATNKAIVNLVPSAEGYTGQISTSYVIAPKELNGTAGKMISEHMTATLKTTSFVYTGNAIRMKKDDITLVDKKTNEDLSNYIYADKDGYVTVSDATFTDAGKISSVKVNLIIGVPETGNKNYKIADDSGNHRNILTSNTATITTRSLNDVTVSIKSKTYNSGKPVVIGKDDVTFTDNEGNVLNLFDQVDVTVPKNATDIGTYTATVTPKDGNKNVTGSKTAELRIVGSDISAGKFANETNGVLNTAKEYTGEQIVITKDDLGTLTIGGASVSPQLYEIVNGANIDVNKGGTVTIKGLGTYEGSVKTVTFKINPAAVSEAKVTNSKVEKIDTSNPADYKDSMGIVVKAKNKNTPAKEFTLVEGTDYKVTYSFDTSNNIGQNVKAIVEITNPNFVGNNVTLTSKITAKAIKSENIKFKQSEYTYTGKAIVPEFDVVIDGKVINPTLYTATATNNLNAGTATLTIKGNGVDYSDVAATATFKINPVDSSKLKGVIGSKQYTGYSLTVNANDIDLTLDDAPIDVASNFALSFGENLNIGEGTVTLTPKNGNFNGALTIKFQIIGKLLNDGGIFTYYDKNGIRITTPKFAYDGTAHTFGDVLFAYSGAEKLKEGTDYELKYVDNVYGKSNGNNQLGAVLAIAKGEYGSSVTNAASGLTNGIYTDAAGNKYTNVIAVGTFEITQEDITSSNVLVSNGTYAGGLPVEPVVNIVVKGVTLVAGKDYKLTYGPNDKLTDVTASKSLTVTVVPMNGYKANGALSFKWGIDKFDLSNADVTVDGDKVTVKCGKVDVEASEYTLEKKEGTVTVTANKDSKNYTGSKTVNAETEDQKPVAPVIADVKVVGNKATVVLAGESEGATGYDYVISKSKVFTDKASRVDVNANVLSTETTFRYVDQGVYYAYLHSWKRVDGKKVFSEWSNAYPFSVSSITPAQPTVTNVKVSGKKVTVTYTKAANATGYDLVLGSKVKKVNGEKRPVEYGKLVKKVYNGNTVTATFTNVPKGTYYAGLHAYNRTSENNGKVFSPWSNTKKVTVK